MNTDQTATLSESAPRGRHAWNKGKLVGQKPPLKPKHVWTIRTQLQLQGKLRDLAMFNFAIDSKLRGCDVVAVRMIDIAPEGHARTRATIRQKKTGRPMTFEITDRTRAALDDFFRMRRRIFRRANIRAWFRNGSPSPDSIQRCMAHIRFAAPRRR